MPRQKWDGMRHTREINFDLSAGSESVQLLSMCRLGEDFEDARIELSHWIVLTSLLSPPGRVFSLRMCGWGEPRVTFGDLQTFHR